MNNKVSKNPLLNSNNEEVNIANLNIQPTSHVQRLFGNFQIQGGYSINSSNISEAIMGKTVVRDDSKNRILGITDDEIIEFDDKIIAGITLATQSILKKFKERIENGTVNYSNIIETLTYIEFTNAAFIDTPEFQEVKTELNKLLANMMKNGSPEEIKMVSQGVLGFFQTSSNNIVKGRKKFKNVPYSIENSKEKEFLRAFFIAEMFEDEVFDFEFLEMSGEIDSMTFEIIEDIYRKSELFTPEQLEAALLVSGRFQSREEILEYYLKNDKKYFVNFATSSEIANYIIKGSIAPKDVLKKIRIDNIKDFEPELLERFLLVSNFPKNVEFIDYVHTNGKNEKSLSKKLLNSLNREKFLKVVFSEKIDRTCRNPYTSEDYIDEYGKLNIEDMMLLESAGKINSEDLIKLTKFKSIQVQDEEEYNKLIERLLAFYDFDKLNELAKANKINANFANLYNKFLNEIITENQRKLYFEKMQKALDESENKDEELTTMVKAGLAVGKDLEHQVSEEYIAEAYLEEEISEKDMMKLYEDGLLELTTIRLLYSDPELLDKYKKGLLDYKVLNILENRADIIKQELKAGKINSMQLMDLYSAQKGLEIDEFIEITEGHDFSDEILVDYLSDEITPDKVEKLFNNYYISQDDLSVLVARNIISKDQAQEFARKIATHEQYESIFALDNRFILLTRETDGGNGGGGRPNPPVDGHKRPSMIKNDPELQELLLSQIGFDERTLVLQGTNNSLDGYRVYPTENYGIMVFLKNDKPGNATYIMTLQQGLYFLNKIVRERRKQTGETELRNSITIRSNKKRI